MPMIPCIHLVVFISVFVLNVLYDPRVHFVLFLFLLAIFFLLRMSWWRISMARSSPSPVMLQEGSTCTTHQIINKERKATCGIGPNLAKYVPLAELFYPSKVSKKVDSLCFNTLIFFLLIWWIWCIPLYSTIVLHYLICLWDITNKKWLILIMKFKGKQKTFI